MTERKQKIKKHSLLASPYIVFAVFILSVSDFEPLILSPVIIGYHKVFKTIII